MNQYGISDLKVLVPKWLDFDLDPGLRAFYDSLEAEIAQRGLQEHIVFHGWIPQSLMPQYYSLGSVTLSLGSFVETFGNTVYELLGCGTPSIVVRIASHRELLPEMLVDKVDYDDTETAAAAGRRHHPREAPYLAGNSGLSARTLRRGEAACRLCRCDSQATPQTELRYRLQPAR